MQITVVILVNGLDNLGVMGVGLNHSTIDFICYNLRDNNSHAYSYANPRRDLGSYPGPLGQRYRILPLNHGIFLLY